MAAHCVLSVLQTCLPYLGHYQGVLVSAKESESPGAAPCHCHCHVLSRHASSGYSWARFVKSQRKKLQSKVNLRRERGRREAPRPVPNVQGKSTFEQEPSHARAPRSLSLLQQQLVLFATCTGQRWQSPATQSLYESLEARERATRAWGRSHMLSTFCGTGEVWLCLRCS